MAPTDAPTVDQRVETRVPTQAQVEFKAPDSFLQEEGSAVLEELSACGLRLRSLAHFRPGETLDLRIPGEPMHVRAQVVWVHEEPEARRRTSKTWRAGCRLEAAWVGRLKIAPAFEGPTDTMVLLVTRLIRLILAGAGLTLFVYAFLRLAMLIGGAWIH